MMKTMELKSYNVSLLTTQEIENTNGGGIGGAALAAKVGCGLGVLGIGIVVGVVVAYGAYKLASWLME